MKQQKRIHPKEKLYDPKEASKYLDEIGCPATISTLATWRCHKQGPSYCKIKNRVFYPQQSLDDYKSTAQVFETIDSLQFSREVA